MATEERPGNLEYCDSSSESDREEPCDVILGRLISGNTASALLKMAKDKKVMKLRCLKHHKRKQIPSDSTLEHLRDPMSTVKTRADEEQETSDTVSEIKSSSSFGTSLHQSINKPNLSMFDFSDDTPNNLSFPALMGGAHLRKHNTNVQDTKFKTPKSQDRMTSLLSSVIEQDQMDRVLLNESPLSSPPPSQPHSLAPPLLSSPPPSGVATAASTTEQHSPRGSSRDALSSLCGPVNGVSGPKCSPLLNGIVSTSNGQTSNFMMPVFNFASGISSEPSSPCGMREVKGGLLSQLTSVERFLEDDSMS